MSGSFFGKTIAVIPLPYETFLTSSFTAPKKILPRKESPMSARFGTILTEKMSSFGNSKEPVSLILARPMRTLSPSGMEKSMLRRVPRGSKPCATSVPL